jgi:homeobox protein cut-like
VQLSERTEAASAAEEKVKELEAKVAEQKILIVKLEEDILKVLINSLSLLPSTSAFTLWDLP